VFWASLESPVAIALLLAGGLVALQTASIVIAFPFSIVMVLLYVALYRQLSDERQVQPRIQRRMQREELTAHVTRTLAGNVDDPSADGAARTGDGFDNGEQEGRRLSRVRR
jgi:choline/glycine/proline betaine transport protein